MIVKNTLTTNHQNTALPWQSVWVTGAGKGIGRALSLALCDAGTNVFASARSEADLISLQHEAEPLSGKIIPCPLDVTDMAAVTGLCQKWNKEGTFPAAAVLNAGTHDPFSAHDFSASRCKTLFAVNLQGTINCLEPLLQQYMANNTGQIVIMASVAGYRGLPTAAAYGASKAALINLAESLYLDLHASNTKIQLLNPGFVRTPLTDKNSFQMPCLIEPEQSAQEILEGMQTDRFEITFPKRFTYWLKLLRVLPYWAYFKVVKRLVQ